MAATRTSGTTPRAARAGGSSVTPPRPEGRGEAALRVGWPGKVVELVGSVPGLEAVDGLLAGAAEAAKRALGPGAVDLLHGRGLGHPLHPALSDLPVGFWSASLLVDLCGEETAAGTLTAAGAVAALGTAATGVADWSATDGAPRRLGLVHGLLNSAALVVELGSLGARLAGRRGAARLLSAAGLATAGAAAWLGGELIQGMGVGVDHTASTVGPEDWTPLLPLADVPEGGVVGVDLEGRRVLVHRGPEGLSVLENACAHLGGPLDEGEVADGAVTCPWHGSRFRLSDGCVLRGPAAFSQRRLQARLRGSRVEVRGRSSQP